MSTVKMQGNASGTGSVTIASPNTNSNQVATLPDRTGNIAMDGPAFSAYNNATQTLSQSTFTKVLFQTEEFDTNNNFTNSTFTPTVAGYYQVTTGIQWTTSQGSAEQILVITKNGASAQGKYLVDTLSATYTLAGSALIYMNGTSDYLEVNAYTANAGTRVINFAPAFTYFQAVLVRAA